MTPGAPGAPLVVSTRCPSCGGPLAFGEGSNAVRCEHCRSNLLVTGRRQVLSYRIDARVGGAEALSKARFATARGAGTRRLGEPRLCMVPYYRLTATELRWQWGEAERSAAEELEEARMRSGVASAVDRLREGGPDLEIAFASAPSAASRRRGVVRFLGRRIERNLLACDAARIASPSLGVRPSALRLDLFRRDAIPEDAVVLPPSLSADAAVATALTAGADEGLVRREVVSRILSVVYFPLWVVPVEGGGERQATVLDAVSGNVVRSDGALATLETAGASGIAATPATPATLGFRALVCPNCGWDLPVAPEDVVFHCGACDRAWLLEGERMLPTPFEVAAAPAGTSPAALQHLPVWEIGCSGGPPAPARFFVPAFRRRNLKVLKDIATRLTQKSPELATFEGDRPELRGCTLDADDATSVARFVGSGLTPDGRPSFPGADVERIDPATARLLWLPFLRDAYGLREPVTGMALPPELAA